MRVQYLGKKENVSVHFAGGPYVFSGPGAVLDIPDNVAQEMRRTNPGTFGIASAAQETIVVSDEFEHLEFADIPPASTPADVEASVAEMAAEVAPPAKTSVRRGRPKKEAE